MRRALAARAALLALALGAAGGPARAADEPAPLLYELPAAGSYELPVIDRVAQRQLTSSAGARAALLREGPGTFTVVSFVYLHCTDAAGCPLALAQLQRLDRALAARPDLSAHVDLATVSFDPARDDPAAMARIRRHMAPRGRWRFLTAGGPEELQPVLEDFGQDAVPQVSDAGRRTGIFQHVTRVFLVDGAGAVRNVYSTGFLDHRLLLRDLETLRLASPP